MGRGDRYPRSLPWRRLGLVALLGYAVAQGAQFVGLAFLPASTASFILSSIPIWVVVLERLSLGARVRPMQVAGVLLAVLGSLLFFYPVRLAGPVRAGAAVMLLGAWATAGATVLTRSLQILPTVGSLRLTASSMALGSGALLSLAWAWEGPAWPGPQVVLIIVYLAVVNTAFAWTLWNHVLRTLPAFELNVLANLAGGDRPAGLDLPGRGARPPPVAGHRGPAGRSDAGAPPAGVTASQ